jgi:hypothetical protein
MLGYSFLLPPPRIQQIKTLLEQTRSALDKHDRSAIEARYAELDRATDEMPAEINFLFRVRRGIGAAREKKMEIEANQLRVALNDIESSMRTGNQERTLSLVHEIEPILEKVKEATGEERRRGTEALAEKA